MEYGNAIAGMGYLGNIQDSMVVALTMDLSVWGSIPDILCIKKPYIEAQGVVFIMTLAMTLKILRKKFNCLVAHSTVQTGFVTSTYNTLTYTSIVIKKRTFSS